MTSRRHRHLIRQVESELTHMELRRWKTTEHLDNTFNKGNEVRRHRHCRHGDHHARFLLILLRFATSNTSSHPVPGVMPQATTTSLSLALTPCHPRQRHSLRHQRARAAIPLTFTSFTSVCQPSRAASSTRARQPRRRRPSRSSVPPWPSPCDHSCAPTSPTSPPSGSGHTGLRCRRDGGRSTAGRHKTGAPCRASPQSP